MRRPPAKGTPPGAVWQPMQLPARARYSPRLTGSGGDTCAISRTAIITPTPARADNNPFIPLSSIDWNLGRRRRRANGTKYWGKYHGSSDTRLEEALRG